MKRARRWVLTFAGFAIASSFASWASLALAADCTPDQIFSSATAYTVGASPFHVITGDFDNDGIADVAAAVNLGYSAAVMISLGNGSFNSPTTYPVGAQGPFGLAAGDFNGDGKLDLVVGNTGGASTVVRLLLGNGNGTLQPAVDIATGTGAGTIAVADFNRDGKLDFATADFQSNSMSVMLGNGDGTFAAPVHYPCGTNPYDIAAADFNGDGHPDIAVCNSLGGDVTVYINSGGGVFASGVHYPADANPYSIVAADLNGDGHPDLAIANGGGGDVTILQGQANGTFVAAGNIVADPQPRSITAADVDGDGDLDLIVGNYDGNVDIIANHGDASFDPMATYLTAGRVTGVAAGDFNADGRPDVVAANYVDFYNSSLNKVTVLMNSCGTTPPPPPGAPNLTGVRDVPNDQGGKVFVTWTGSVLDLSGGVIGYRVWRRIPPALGQTMRVGSARSRAGSGEVRRQMVVRRDGTLDVTYWEPIAELPAEGLAGYGYTAPTTQDSIPAGNPYTAFFVTAFTQNPTVFYESNVDSGYSVDNLAPDPPAPFLGTYTGGGVALHWPNTSIGDFQEYRIYRGGSSTFPTDVAHLVRAQSDTGLFDASGSIASYYKISAVDVHGNASAPTLLSPPQSTEVPDADLAMRMNGVTPNPSTNGVITVSFTLGKSGGASSLELLDLSGRRLAQVSMNGFGAGAHNVDFGRDQRLPGGIYWVKLTQGGRTSTAKAVITR